MSTRRSTSRVSRAGVAAMFVAGGLVVWLQASTLSPQQADSFARKMVIIERQGDVAPAPAAGSRRTAITQDELNSWFAYRARPMLPSGIADPRMMLLGNDKVTATATVDLDAVGKTHASGGLLDPWNLLGGRVPVTVTGILRTSAGSARFELERADIAGVPVPQLILQQVLSSYSKTPEHPAGVRLDDPFALPANIRQIELGQSQAVVIQ